MSEFGLYVHIPFCLKLCPYCAFISVTGQDELRDRYVDAVCREIQREGEGRNPNSLTTIFFGGGTPSVLEPDQLGRILHQAEVCLGWESGAEITIEVNPGTADQRKFSGFRDIGFNRLSIGVQAFRDEALQKLGRVHRAADGEKAYEIGRRAGFDNVSFDLIFSIPEVPEACWQSTLERAVELGPEHISTYALIIEEGTDFFRRLHEKQLQPVDEDVDARVYEWTLERLIRAGYEQYEVSNFARPGRHCRHNWGCWSGAPYLGVGLAAHSFREGRRSWNLTGLREYIQASEEGRSTCEGWEEIDACTAWRERVWMGLRTDRGIGIAEREHRCLELSPRFRDLLSAGFFELSADRLRLTRSGMALADALGVEIAEILEKPQIEGAKLSDTETESILLDVNYENR